MFADYPGIEVTSAGTNNDAIVPLTDELVEWADAIFVMEKLHRNKVQRKFRKPLSGKRVVCLEIPDDYEFMDDGLVRLLKARMRRFLPIVS